MSLEALTEALEKNPDLEASSETLAQFVDSAEFFEGFLTKKYVKEIGRFKGRLYKNEGNLLKLITKKKGLFKKYVQSKYKTLGNITQNKTLALVLGLPDGNESTIAKACVEHRFLSPEIPDNHPISRGGSLSWYINPEVVGTEQAESNLKKYVQYTYRTLDDLNRNRALASALGLLNWNISTIAKALVERGFLSPEIPDGYTISKKSGFSWYLHLEVVGAEQAESNLKKYVQYTYRTLDNVTLNGALASTLDLPDRNGGTIAKALVERGFLSPEIPDNHSIGKIANLCRYVDPEVVGAEQAESNLKKYVQYTYRTLDDITENTALASVLGTKNNIRSIAKACVERGFLNANIPDNYPIGKSGNISWYIDSKIVGTEQAESNLKKYVQYTYRTLDDITKDQAVASALGLPNINRSTIAKACIERGFLSPEIPDNHSVSKTSHPSWYINPEVVGAEQAESNLKKYVQYTYRTLDDITVYTYKLALATALGVKNKISALRSKIAELGWLEGSDGLRSHVNLITPKNNLLEDLPKIDSEYAKEISRLGGILRGLKNQNSKYEYHAAISPFSGFGKCYENFVGILLALEHSKIEHQIKLNSNGSEPFRVADFGTFGNGSKGYLTLEDLERFFEVKSGVSISKHDEGQLSVFLTQNKDLVYILQDKNSRLAERLRELSPNLDIRTHSDLKGYEIVRDSDICNLFDDKANFSSYKSSSIISRLERDLFSLYLHIKGKKEKGETIEQDAVYKLLKCIYLQNDEAANQLSQEQNIKWLEKKEYDRMKSLYLDGNSGRRYIDPRIVIERIKKDIEREKEKAKQIEIKQMPKLKIKELYEGLRCWHIPLEDFHEQITNLSPEIYNNLIERAEMNKKHQNQAFSFSGYLPG